jgi:hypothetical protein
VCRETVDQLSLSSVSLLSSIPMRRRLAAP